MENDHLGIQEILQNNRQPKHFWQRRDWDDRLTYTIMLIPAIILIFSFSVFPLINVFAIAFTNMKYAIDPPTWNGFNTFAWALRNPYFTDSFLRTLKFTGLSLLGSTSLGILLAVILNQDNIPGRDIFRTIVLYGWIIPEVITSIIFRFIFASNYGLINHLLDIFGLAQPAWLNDPVLTPYVLVLVNIWRATPFNILVYLTALQSVNKEWYEAAELDGANGWQKFRYISLAVLQPTMFVTILLGIIWTSNTFFLPFVMTQGGPLDSTTLWSILIYNTYFTQPQQIARAAAMSVFVFLLLAMIGAIYFIVLKRTNAQAE
jgi:multiple sugar transport system permease protein